MTTPTNIPPESPPPDSWERVASTLRACKEAQKQTWGDLDSSTLGRYLAGEVADDELGVIERELADHPELRQLTDIIRDVLGDLAPVAEPSPGPTVLSFEKAHKSRRVLPFLRRHAALAAAACLLVVLGAVVPAGGLLPSRGGVLVATSEEVHFLDNGVATASSPTIPFNALGMPAPAGLAAYAPNPEPSRPEMKVHAPFAGGIAAKDAARGDLGHVKLMMTSRGAAAHLRRGRDEARDGRVVDAERSLSKSYAHCQEHLGAKHPITTQAAQELANLYAFALNDDYARAPGVPDLVFKTSPDPVSDKKTGEAAALGERIAGQTLPQIQATVVPALVRALETAPTAAERQTMVSALGHLGPAAGPALPALRSSLDNATAAERQTILHTMGRIGPASVPILDQLANADRPGTNDLRNSPNNRANLSDDDRTLIRGTLRELRCPESHAGIADEAACLSFREIRAASVRIHRLAKAKQPGILVLIQTKAACRPGDAACPHRLGKRGVLVVLDLAGNVEVKVSPALTNAGFSAAAVREAMLAACKAKQYDKACDAGIDRIVAQAAKLKPGRP